MNGNRKNVWSILFLLEASVCVLAVLWWFRGRSPSGGVLGGNITWALLSFPYEPAACALRRMSLSGAWGNAFALLLYAAGCALHVIYGGIRLFRKRARVEELLLILLSALLYPGMYLLVNPAYIDSLMGRAGMTDVGRMAIYSAIGAVIVCYVILRFVRFAAESTTGRLLGLFKALLGVVFAVQVLHIFGIGFAGFMEAAARTAAGNQGAGDKLAVTVLFLCLRWILKYIPAAAQMVLIVLACRLAGAMKEERYGEGTVREAGRLAKASRSAAVAVSLSFVVLNLSQLFFSQSLLDLAYEVNLPLDTLAFTLAAMIMAEYIAKTRQLKQEHDLII